MNIEIKFKNRRVLGSRYRFCFICMERHYIDTIKVTESIFTEDGEQIFTGMYDYCCNDDSYYAGEEMLNNNAKSYRKALKLKVAI